MCDLDAVNQATKSPGTAGKMSRRQFGTLALAAGVGSALPSAALEPESKGHAGSQAPVRNADLFRQIIERGFNQGDLTVADEVRAPKIVEHQYLMPPGVPGPEHLKNDIVRTRQAVQHLVLTIEDLVESDDKVWTRTVCRGIESRTGKPFVMDVFDICRFDNGKIVEHWGVPDRFAMLHQVGLLPPTLA
jgi:ketosteroid isomerase-like protein